MKYIGKKLATMLITVLIVTMLVFLAFRVIPGDPVSNMLGTSATEEKVANLREQLGLNRPLPVRYIEWVRDFFFGDMGKSYTYGMSVKSMLASKIPITITLTVMSFILVVLISIPLGIYCAKHEDKWYSKAIDVINQITMSVPSFFVGMIITYIFGLVLRWFRPGAFVNYKTSVVGFLGYLIFPAISIALPKAAMTVKLLKSSVLKEGKLDYVRTAYSRGNSTDQVLYKHVFKNALIPVITFLGVTLADMVAGSIIVEQVFSIPGLGRLLITSISTRDYPVAQAIIAIIACIVIFINFMVDILYKVIDPRISK
ncbi:MAG: ABC transporter permease [Lachnospiraceae bacterium]|nr:ABC transporter permease [Lachnospiraceae bacterium]